jgi:hypothetical protein
MRSFLRIAGWLAAAALALTAHAQTAAPPVLSVSLDNAITQPGNLRLIRPLVLYISDWQGQKPRARAWTNTGAVTAEVTRIPGSPGHWNATVRYSVVEAEGAAPATGELTLRLTLHGATVLGSFEGRFRDLQLRGTAQAGLTWDLSAGPNGDGLLWLPDPARPVRAALIWGSGTQQSGKSLALREDLQAFAAANNLAVVGLGTYAEPPLKALGEMSGHPELDRVPILFTGHSAGSVAAYEFNAMHPERVIAFTVSHSGARLNWQVSERARANPAILAGGEKDAEALTVFIHRLFDGNRPAGALWSVEFEEGEAHGFGRSLPLFLLHFQHALDQRLPAGATEIRPVDPKRAWYANNATWKDGITRIFPAAGFKGDATHLSWLLDRDVAYVYRGVATFGDPLVLARTAGHSVQYFADEPVVLECADFGEGEWKSVGLYDGAERIAVIAPGKPRVTLKPQKTGAHAGVLIGERPDGSLRTSWPVAWVVRPAL